MPESLDQVIAFIGGHADVWAIFRDGRLFSQVVVALAKPLRTIGITKIVGVEARVSSSAGPSPLTSEWALPRSARLTAYNRDRRWSPELTHPTAGRTYEFRLQTAAVIPGDRVVLFDDWIETGNQALAARSMIEQCGGEWVGISVVVDHVAADRKHLVGHLRALTDATELSEA